MESLLNGLINSLATEEEFRKAFKEFFDHLPEPSKELEDYRNSLEFNKQFERFIGSIQEYPNSLRISINSDSKFCNVQLNLHKTVFDTRRIKNHVYYLGVEVLETLHILSILNSFF